mmetsp:Transcript_16083/g.21135  ORF Transcript_16083/g.21135 Transcript_16083/m.21135 type:complete len:131 (+) Transcript_16083:71-463(+)
MIAPCCLKHSCSTKQSHSDSKLFPRTLFHIKFKNGRSHLFALKTLVLLCSSPKVVNNNQSSNEGTEIEWNYNFLLQPNTKAKSTSCFPSRVTIFPLAQAKTHVVLVTTFESVSSCIEQSNALFTFFSLTS